MNKDDPIFQAWRDSTNAYLAGLGLPPLPADPTNAAVQVGSPLWHRLLKPTHGQCAECGHDTEDRHDDEFVCDGCNAEIVRGQENDKRLDSPSHRQAEWINVQR